MRRSTLYVAWFCTILSGGLVVALPAFWLLVASGMSFGPDAPNEGDVEALLRGVYISSSCLAAIGVMAYAVVRAQVWGWWGLIILLGGLSVTLWWAAAMFGLSWLFPLALVPTLCLVALLRDSPRRWQAGRGG